MKNTYTLSISAFLLIAAIYYSFSSLLPNKISKMDAPPSEFSTERALVHLKEIAKKPHYVGTEEHTVVRDYLIAALEEMNLEVSVQTQLGVSERGRSASITKNILARIKGTSNNDKALVLMTHYDSASHASYGASDAGSGLVAILEGIRAFLATNKAVANDIIILFTDAEEIGLLGAEAFVDHHPWAKDVGLVLNFEARGSGGPSYMLLETNGGNKKLINAFKEAKPNYPIANSLMYSIYKMLPNDTDLTVFREDASINGFNFAFIDDHFDYHTAGDTYENLDRNTLEQQGDYLMTMLDYFANKNLSELDDNAESIYFDFPIPFLRKSVITYPFTWVLPMSIGAFLLFFVIVFMGLRIEDEEKKLTYSGIFAGFVPFLGTLILSGVVTVYGWKVIQIIHPSYNEILQGFTYNGYWYIAAFSALTLGMCFGLYKRYFKKHTAENLMVAPLFIWGLLNGAIAMQLQGAGFFVFPFYIGLLSLAVLLFSKQKAALKVLFLTFLAIPVLLVLAPLVKMFPVGLGLKMLAISAVFIVLIFGLLIPLFHKYGNTKILSTSFLIMSVFFLFYASFNAGYTKEQQQPTSLIYLLDVDENQGYWASFESTTNTFSQASLSKPVSIVNRNEKGLNRFISRYKIYEKTDPVALVEPLVEILSDTVIQKKRKLHLQITRQRKTNRIDLIALDSINFYDLKIKGQTLYSDFNISENRSILRYFFADKESVLDLTFSIPENENLSIKMRDITYDLLTNKLLNVAPRKDETMISTPFIISDATIIEKTIDLSLN